MSDKTAFYREAGTGTGVVCLHSNSSSSGQWRALLEMLASDYHVFAADSYGSGKSPPWSGDRPVSLSDEAEFISPVLNAAGNPFFFVGHSYGAAVALICALQDATRIRGMALYEPTLFAVVNEEKPPPNDADGIRNAVAASAELFAAGDSFEASRVFIDYWMAPGTFERMPERVQQNIEQSIGNLAGWGNALQNEPTPLADFSRLEVPVLLMTGSESPPSSLAVARLLEGALPNVDRVDFKGLGHMGPVTHPQVVNEAIRDFLQQH